MAQQTDPHPASLDTAPGRLIARLERAGAVRVLCLGDVMLDRFVQGTVERISPEAPIPVLRVAHETTMPGGVGNVARNVRALGAQVRCIGAAGKDSAADMLEAAFAADGADLTLIRLADRPTTVKTRFVAGSQHLLRADQERAAPLDAAGEDQVLAAFRIALASADVALLSDYAKGVLTDRVVREAIAAAHAAGVPVLVDPKSRDFARYAGATLLTPNLKELRQATDLPCRGDDDTAAAARLARDRAGVSALLVTRSEKGMTLLDGEDRPHHLPAEAREVFDVSGAGDTVLATLAVMLAAGATLTEAAGIANAAAGLVVGKVGTAVVHPQDLLAVVQAHGEVRAGTKVLLAAQAEERARQWRARGLTVGFTNGCFDLLHPGHISLLRQARAACDRLVVGLNTDASVQRLKGPARPVQAEQARSIVLASLESVDAVVLFDEDTPLRLIEALRPDVLVKGADYTVETVVGSAVVQSYGGRVLLARLEDGFSTTRTISRLTGTNP